MNLEDELAELIKIRDYANKRIRELRSIKYISNPSPKKSAVPKPQGKYLWVQTNCIGPHIRAAIKKGDTATAIAMRAGVSFKTIAWIRDEVNQWTREDIADKIMMALDLPHVHLETVAIRRAAPEPPPNKYYED